MPRKNEIIFFIYIIRCENFVKIGFSKKSKTRLFGISHSTPFEVKLVKIFATKNKQSAIFHERWAHFALKKFWTKNEWFKVTPKKAELVIVKVIGENKQTNPPWMVLSGRVIKATESQNWTEEKRKAQSARIKAQEENSNFRKIAHKAMVEYWDKPESRKAAADRASKQYENKEFRKKMSIGMSNRTHKRMNKPGAKKEVSRRMSEYWSKPKNRQAQSDRVAAYWANKRGSDGDI